MLFYPKQIKSSLVRVWSVILALQIAAITALFFFVGKSAFFLIGPFLLYDIILYTYPFWNIYWMTSHAVPYKGAEFQNSQKILKDVFGKWKRLKPELLMLNTELNNLVIFTHRNRIWVITDKKFMDSLELAEQRLIFEEILALFRSERLSSATVYSALHMTLPFWPVRKGTELNFFSKNQNENWLFLNYKTFHRLSLKQKPAQAHLLPCLFFPALPNYSSESYFSLYTVLRERLIKSMKPSVENPEPQPGLQGELL